jgi:hypothetical protein
MGDIDKVAIEKLDVDNYPAWATKIRFLLITKGLWAVTQHGPASSSDVATQGVPTPTPSELTSEKDQKALAQIGLHVMNHHLATVAACTTAKEAWDKFESTYKSKSNARRQQLRHQLLRLKLLPGEPLTKYFARAKGINNLLADINHAVSSDELLMCIVDGLPTEYGRITDVLPLVREQLDMDDLLPELLIIEEKITKHEEESVAAYTSYDNRQGSWGPQGGAYDNRQGSRGPQGGCYDNRHGSWRPRGGYRDQDRGRENRRRGHGNEARGDGSGYSYSQDNRTPGAREGPRCYGCNEYGHIRRDCPKEKESALMLTVAY